MKRLILSRIPRLLTVTVGLAVFTGAGCFLLPDPKVDFNAEVKPLFNKKCITCHGGVRQKGDFSLLFRKDALLPAKSGKAAIIPGDPGHSEMIRRIMSDDPEIRMPFHGDPLTAEEKTILKRWIKQGAVWGDHWAYVPVKKVAVPDAPDAAWAKNNIDHFIGVRQKEAGLHPAAEADRKTLVRRVSLDVIGLPASTEQSAAFLQSGSDADYAALVDSLLASPHYGEKWASLWLDLARYADSKGYERDTHRDIWRYRDWVIRSFNQDKPYDVFLTEQLAGDLLPHPSEDQFIATAFQRNTMTNDEGGTDNEEFRTVAVMDRVSSTWQGVLGTTFACVQCHSHPYDPFRHEEYYKFLAFFNDTRDEDSYGDYPLQRSLSDSAKTELKKLTDWTSLVAPERTADINEFIGHWQPAMYSQDAKVLANCAISDDKWLAFRHNASARLANANLEGKKNLLYRFAGYVPGGICSIRLDSVNGPLLVQFGIEATKDGGWKQTNVDFPLQHGMHDLYFSYTNPRLKKPEDSGAMLDWLYFNAGFPGEGQPKFEEMERRFLSLAAMDAPGTPVMMDNPAYWHRKSYVFERGNWLSKGAEVTPDVPHSLNPLPKNAPRNRLGLAEWIVAPENPLTARTLINRLWEQLYGYGLAETLEDLGTQGVAPTHPELLDYLSYKLMHDNGWSIKKTLREMLLSATYRQNSRITPQEEDKDPQNRFYARGPRVRLTGEQIRDQALAVTGLLSNKMYGPAVFPYQPKGIWLTPWGYNVWKKSDGEDQYRRAVYTYCKRSSPYPSMMTFDGADRAVCTVRRIRTNTPLQALVTLNDSAFLEMAAVYAGKVMQMHPGPAAVQIRSVYEQALGHPMDSVSFRAMTTLYNKALAGYRRFPEKARQLDPVRSEKPVPEKAALTVVVNAILNLDEFVTKS